MNNPEPAIAQFGAKRTPIPTRRAVGAQLSVRFSLWTNLLSNFGINKSISLYHPAGFFNEQLTMNNE